MLAALPLCAAAQLSNLFKTDNQALVEQAIANGIVLVEQSYQLSDSAGKHYGRYGEEEFGTITSIGVRVDSSLVVTEAAASPWRFDENFDRYRDSYTPVLYQTCVYNFGDSASGFNDSIQLEYVALAENLYYVPSSDGDLGYTPRKYNGATEGWAAWVYADKDANGEMTVDCKYVIVKQKHQLSAKVESISVQAPQDGKEYIGGVFIVPEQTAVGQLTFFLAGIMVYDYDKESWVLAMPSKIFESSEGAGVEETSAGIDELTPTIKQVIGQGNDLLKDKKTKDKKKR